MPVADEFHYSLTWCYERPDAQKPFKSLFTVKEALLNTFLANITLSAIGHFDFWPTNDTSAEPRSQYFVSQPLDLTHPVIFPHIGYVPAVGGLGPLRPTVPATDGEFLQFSSQPEGNRH